MSINEFEINEAEIGGVVQLPGTYEIGFIESVSLDSILGNFVIALPIKETLVVNAESNATVSLVYSADVNIADSISSTSIMGMALYSSLNVKTKNYLAMSMSFIEDSLIVDGSLSINSTTIISFVENLLIKSSVTTTHRALMHLAESIVITAKLDLAYALNLAEAMNVETSIVFDYRAVMSILESIVVSETQVLSARIVFEQSENINIESNITTAAKMILSFKEGLIIGGTINTPDGVYEVWVVNAETKAPWQYDNYPFNSFAFTGNKYLALADSGLYELTGSDDDGTNIDTVIRTGLENFNSNQKKSIPWAYFGYTSSGRLLFRTITTATGQKVENWYELEARTADDDTETRVNIGRGLRSVYWQFELTNIDGAEFELDDIQLMPARLKRRL